LNTDRRIASSFFTPSLKLLSRSVCPETSLFSLRELAERLRSSIEEHDFNVVKNCTASFGVGSAKPGDTIEILTERADQELYRAKNNGRNRICSN